MQGHFEKAYEYHHKALATLLEKLGENNKVSGHNAADKTPMYDMPLIFVFGVLSQDLVAECYSNICILYSNRKEFDKALTYHEKSLAIWLQVAGSEISHIVAEPYHDIRTVYSLRGDLQKALDFFQKSLEIRRKTLGNSHYQVGNTLHSWGELSESSGKLVDATKQLPRGTWYTKMPTWTTPY